LLHEYSKSGNEIVEGGKKLGAELDTIRAGILKAFGNYCTAVSDTIAAEKPVTKDPWLAEQVYRQCLKSFKVEKEKFSQDMGKLYERFLRLEEKRAEEIKAILQTYVAKQKLVLSKMLESFGDLVFETDKINPIADRQLLVREKFSQTRASMAPSQQTPGVPADHIATPLPVVDPVVAQLQATFVIDEPPDGIKPVMAGYLFRQRSVIKSWKKNYFVLSGSGFLHYFPSEDILSNVSESTIPLANVSVQHVTTHEEKNVFEVVVNPGRVFRHSKYLLRAEDEGNMVDWIVCIKKVSGIKN